MANRKRTKGQSTTKTWVGTVFLKKPIILLSKNDWYWQPKTFTDRTHIYDIILNTDTISILIPYSCGTVALYGLFIYLFFLAAHTATDFTLSKNLWNSYQEYVAPFNSNFHNKTLCESGVMWITRFVTYLSIAFHIYLLIIIHF
jgi:hypothetical protein